MMFTRLNPKIEAVLLIQCAGMLSGTATHLWWPMQHGFLSENYRAPFLSMLFWDSLTFLDPLAAVLLLLKPKAGVWLTALIMLVDVMHNSLFTLWFGKPFMAYSSLTAWITDHWMLLCQLAFGLFVFLTLKSNLREINSTTGPQAKPTSKRLVH